MKYINTYLHYVFIPYINLYAYLIHTTCISKRLPGMGGGLGVVDQHQVLVEKEKLLPESARHILELQQALLNVTFREGGGGGGKGGGQAPYEGQKERGRDTREDDELADEDEDEEGEGDGGELIGLLANNEEEEEESTGGREGGERSTTMETAQLWMRRERERERERETQTGTQACRQIDGLKDTKGSGGGEDDLDEYNDMGGQEEEEEEEEEGGWMGRGYTSRQ